MAVQIDTKRDVLRRTGRRVATAASRAVVMLTTMLLVRFGPDLTAHVTIAEVFNFDLFAGVLISTTVCAVLSYRSGLLMMELTRARRELASISQTDQLSGFFNRRGFNEVAATALGVAERDSATAAVFMCDIDHSSRSTTVSGTRSAITCSPVSRTCCGSSPCGMARWSAATAARSSRP